MKKRVCALLLTGALLTGLGTQALGAEAAEMTDLQGHWAAEAAASGIQAGLFQGVGDNRFAPDAAVSRAMFVTVLGRFAKSQKYETAGAAGTGFQDVEKDQWYTEFVNWAAANKIVNGMSQDRFGVEEPVTRQQLCAMIYRFLTEYCKLELPETKAEESFSDEAAISAYAKDAVAACQALGLVQGSGGAFRPESGATRGEMAMIFFRLTKTMETLRQEEKPSNPGGGQVPAEQKTFPEAAQGYKDQLAEELGENPYFSVNDGIRLTVPLSQVLQDEFQFQVVVNGIGSLSVGDLLNDRAALFSYATKEMMAEMNQVGQTVMDQQAVLNAFLARVTRIEVTGTETVFLKNSAGQLKFAPGSGTEPVLKMLAGLSSLLTKEGNGLLLSQFQQTEKTSFLIPITVYGKTNGQEDSYESVLTLTIS